MYDQSLPGNILVNKGMPVYAVTDTCFRISEMPYAKSPLISQRPSSPLLPFISGDRDDNDPFTSPSTSYTIDSAEPALLLTIRPSLSLPDIHLDVTSPSTISVARLKQQIRERLGVSHCRARIRLIYRGRILEDTAILGQVVKSLPSAPPPPSWVDDYDGTGKEVGKGKAKGKQPMPIMPRIFINASIGDILSKEDLEKEDKLASCTILTPQHPGKKTVAQKGPSGEGTSAAAEAATMWQGANGDISRRNFNSNENESHVSTNPAPRGFDRLLTTGFSRSEVNALKLQFRSIQQSRHTMDSMPSPDTLRNMEDAWIDGNAFVPPSYSSSTTSRGVIPGVDDDSGTVGVVGMNEEDETARLVDVMVMAAAIGFFWPMGTLAWLVRQKDGISAGTSSGIGAGAIWSQNWHFLAIVGLFCSMMLSLVKNLVGEGE